MDNSCFYRPFPVIELEEIILREIRGSDATMYYAYMNSDYMTDIISAEHIPNTLEDAKKELDYWSMLFPLKTSIYWALANKKDELIGTAGFNHISTKNDKAEISYDLAPDCWGRGYMSDAINSIIKFAQDDLNLVRIQATVATENIRSINLLEKCNFYMEGKLAKYEIINGIHKDYFMYSKILI
ncbi:MAG TPA: GNAT family protein [Candidatus Megaira endosymbiont of Nemacystus decipiens]|nr:GNAT family protein [Candidatus Megaera endosymbiont of Nemacystus decipiens]